MEEEEEDVGGGASSFLGTIILAQNCVRENGKDTTKLVKYCQVCAEHPTFSHYGTLLLECKTILNGWN